MTGSHINLFPFDCSTNVPPIGFLIVMSETGDIKHIIYQYAQEAYRNKNPSHAIQALNRAVGEVVTESLSEGITKLKFELISWEEGRKRFPGMLGAGWEPSSDEESTAK